MGRLLLVVLVPPAPVVRFSDLPYVAVTTGGTQAQQPSRATLQLFSYARVFSCQCSGWLFLGFSDLVHSINVSTGGQSGSDRALSLNPARHSERLRN